MIPDKTPRNKRDRRKAERKLRTRAGWLDTLQARYAPATTDEALAAEAAKLSWVVTVASLRRLDVSIGPGPNGEPGQLIVWEKTGTGLKVGRGAGYGDPRGIIRADDWLVGMGPVLIVRGGANVAAGLAMELRVIGLSPGGGGEDELIDLLGRKAFRERNIPVIFVTGQESDKAAARRLADALGESVLCLPPPGGAKDILAWADTQHRLIDDGSGAAALGQQLLDELKAMYDGKCAEVNVFEPLRVPANEVPDTRPRHQHVAAEAELEPAGLSLTEDHLADLRKSGLSDATIVAAGLHSLTEFAPSKLLNWKRGSKRLGPCLVIPYFDKNGTPTGYYRLKPSRPRHDDNARAIKYEAPVGQPNRLYIPPGCTRAALADPSAPLLITEGEKKALKADQEGFACVGLSGVWSWQKKREADPDGRKRGPRELIDDLDAIRWKGRTVYVCFDSDAAHNPKVRLAEDCLAEVLTERGAILKIIRLPDGPAGADGQSTKVGLDDYLLAHTADELRQLLHGESPEDRELREMLEEEDARQEKIKAMKAAEEAALTPEEQAARQADKEARAKAEAEASAARKRIAKLLCGAVWAKGPRPRHPCMSGHHHFATLRNVGRGFIGPVPCGNLACPRCQALTRDRWVRELTVAVLHETPPASKFIGKWEEFRPVRDLSGKVEPLLRQGQLPVRTEPVWTWKGPARNWKAIHRQILRAGAKAGRPCGCTRVLLGGADDGKIFVLADVQFKVEGVTSVPPAEAALQLARLLVNVPARRGFVSRGRSWKPEPKPVTCVDLGRVCEPGEMETIIVEDGKIVSGGKNLHEEILLAGGADLEEITREQGDGTERTDLAYSLPKGWVPSEVQLRVSFAVGEITRLEHEAAKLPRKDRLVTLRAVRNNRKRLAAAVRELLDDVHFALLEGSPPVTEFRPRVSEFSQAIRGKKMYGKTPTGHPSEFDLSDYSGPDAPGPDPGGP